MGSGSRMEGCAQQGSQQRKTYWYCPVCARQEPDHVRFAAETFVRGGIPVLEVPLTVPKAAEVIEAAKRYPI